MPYRVSCNHCGSPFSITDELFTRKVKGRLVTIRCKRCNNDMRLDDTGGAVQSPKAAPDDEHAPDADAISDSGIELTPTIPLAAATSRPRNETPEQPETPELPETSVTQEPQALGETAKPLWVVSYAEDDDRELTLLQIKAALEHREIDRETIVWQEGMAEWLPIAKVKPLAALVSAPPRALPNRSVAESAADAVRRPTSNPPPKPDSKSADPELPGAAPSPKPPVISQQTVATLASDKANTQPELPKARQKPPLPTRTEAVAKADADEALPPSSGSPALSTLTRKESEKKVDAELDDFFLNMQRADSEAHGPPNIDISGIGGSSSGDALLLASTAEEPTQPGFRTPASVPEGEAKRRPRKRRAKTQGEAADDVEHERASAAPRTARERSVLSWIIVLGAALLCAWWLFFRSRLFEAPTANMAAQQLEHVEPTPPKANTMPPAIAENHDAPEPPPAATPKELPPTLPTAPGVARAKGVRSGAASAPAQRSSKPASNGSVDSLEAEPEASGPAATAPSVLSEPAVEKPVSIGAPFDKAAAQSSLGDAAAQAATCRKEGDPIGNAVVVVTFAPSGRVTSAAVTGPPFAGTAIGGCIASTLRRAKVPPFSGDHVTVSKTVVIR